MAVLFCATVTAFSEYDQDFGMRGKRGIPNAEGITNFMVAYNIDRTTGGKAVPETSHPTNWMDNDITTSVDFDISHSDGNVIRFWVKAQDFVDHVKNESVLVRVDSSPPVISNIWLQRDGILQFAVHYTADFTQMR